MPTTVSGGMPIRYDLRRQQNLGGVAQLYPARRMTAVIGCIYVTWLTLLLIGATVFHGTWNFDQSRRICQFPQNFYVFAEFCTNRFWPYCMYAQFRHEIHDCWLGSKGRNIETIDMTLSEILQVYLVDNCICQFQLQGAIKLIAICRKFPHRIFRHRIWQTALRNVKKFAAENCGP